MGCSAQRNIHTSESTLTTSSAIDGAMCMVMTACASEPNHPLRPNPRMGPRICAPALRGAPWSLPGWLCQWNAWYVLEWHWRSTIFMSQASKPSVSCREACDCNKLHVINRNIQNHLSVCLTTASLRNTVLSRIALQNNIRREQHQHPLDITFQS